MKIPPDRIAEIVNAPAFRDIIGQTTASIPWETLPHPGYSIPMVLGCAKEFSNYIVDHVPHFSSADHGNIYKILSHILKHLAALPASADFKPFFLYTYHIDESIKQVLLAYRNSYLQLNTIISLKEGIWNLELNGEDFFLTINPQHRRNALHILNEKANYLANNEKVLALFEEPDKIDLVRLSLETGTEELDILTKGVQAAWQQLAVSLGFNTQEFTCFKGFVSYLQKLEAIWFQFADLESLFTEYLNEYSFSTAIQNQLRPMLDFFSISFDEADNWISPCPFYKFGDYFIFWPFCFHVMHPDLAFINLIHRKYANEWNNTLGANMAQIASYLVDQLQPLSTLMMVAEKKKGNLGDIDIAIYDHANDHLLLLEVKSVFDKFRTNYQSSNYIEQKVNVTKAATQLKRIEQAIRNGSWRLGEIFNGVRNQVPQKISKAILTWWDLVPVDDIEHEDILTLNFKTFGYLLSISDNNLNLLIEAIKKLGETFCPYSLASETFFEGTESVSVYRQLQSDLLPPKSMRVADFQNPVIAKAAGDLPSFPENWQEQLLGTDASYYFY